MKDCKMEGHQLLKHHLHVAKERKVILEVVPTLRREPKRRPVVRVPADHRPTLGYQGAHAMA